MSNAIGSTTAAAVATARKLSVMIWHVLTEGTEYAYARPAFTAMKLRKAALKAGAPREYGKAGPGRDYWIKEIREREADHVQRAEPGLRAHGGGVEGKAAQGSGQGRRACLRIPSSQHHPCRGRCGRLRGTG